MVARVLGWRMGVKDGNRSFSLCLETNWEDWEGADPNKVCGTKTFEEWTNRVDCSMLKPGDKIELGYSKGFKGMAVLSDIKVISEASSKAGNK